MTIRELAEHNQLICDIEIDVRNAGHLENRYRFGDGAKYYSGDNSPMFSGGKTFRDITVVDKTEINAHDMGKDYYQVKLNRIPKRFQSVLDEDVCSWNLSHAYRGLSSFYASAKCLHVTIDAGWMAQPFESETEEKHSAKDEQLEGQSNIFDFLED